MLAEPSGAEAPDREAVPLGNPFGKLGMIPSNISSLFQ